MDARENALWQSERLKGKIEFFCEVDKIKNIFRQSKIHDGSRRENDAEHSRHLALMAFYFYEYSKVPNIDLLKVMKMCLIHDIVEIDAGDTFCYDAKGNLDKLEREQKAADCLFSILPGRSGEELRHYGKSLMPWKLPEAKFAASMDRLQPVLLNYLNKGGTWQGTPYYKRPGCKA